MSLECICSHWKPGVTDEMQFSFQEGVDYIEASFTILETINHMLEHGSNIFSCFLNVRL